MLTLVKLPVLAELDPTVVPSIAPPLMSADEVDKEFRLAAPVLLIVLKAPVLTELDPMAVPSIDPPFMSAEVAVKELIVIAAIVPPSTLSPDI